MYNIIQLEVFHYSTVLFLINFTFFFIETIRSGFYIFTFIRNVPILFQVLNQIKIALKFQLLKIKFDNNGPTYIVFVFLFVK